jgi:hypothetical protein
MTMATIKEDYCSKEIYRLLIEKGFDGEIHTSFDEEGCTQASITLQMAMKWLREVHNIHIDIDPEWTSKGGFSVIGYCFNIHSIANPWYEDFVVYPTYEQAVEAANKYCLENLI